MLKKVLSYFRKKPEVTETRIEESNIYEQKALKEQELKEQELKEKFKEYASFQKGETTIYLYFKENFPQKEKEQIQEDITEKIIVTNNTVNVYIEIDYLVKKSLWINGINKQNEIVLFIDKV